MDRDVHGLGREGSPISDSAYNSGPGKPDAPDELVSFLNLALLINMNFLF